MAMTAHAYRNTHMHASKPLKLAHCSHLVLITLLRIIAGITRAAACWKHVETVGGHTQLFLRLGVERQLNTDASRCRSAANHALAPIVARITDADSHSRAFSHFVLKMFADCADPFAQIPSSSRTKKSGIYYRLRNVDKNEEPDKKKFEGPEPKSGISNIANMCA